MSNKPERDNDSDSGTNEHLGKIDLQADGVTFPAYVSWSVLGLCTLAAFMAALDSNVVSVALPTIGHDLSSGVSLLGWVITAYLLGTAAFLLQAGKLADLYGKKRIYLVGLALFGSASTLSGLSQGIFQLIGFRVIQGASAALLTSTAGPLVFSAFPQNRRGSAMGIFSIAWAIGFVAGPVLGGLLTSVNWRLIFYINVPISLVGVLIGKKLIPSTFNQVGSLRNGIERRINYPSFLLLALTIVSFFVWLTIFNILFLAIAAVGLLVLVVRERKSTNPLLNKVLRHNRGFLLSAVGLSVEQLAFLGMPLTLSLYFQLVFGKSPLLTGLFIAPLPLALMVANPFAGRLYDKVKTPALSAVLGSIFCGLATLTLSFVLGSTQTDPLWIEETLLMAIGIGNAFVWTPMISSMLSFVRFDIRSVASGTSSTLIQIGFATSIALITIVSASYLPHDLVKQVYLGSLNSLDLSLIGLLRNGIDRVLTIFSLVYFASAPVFYFVALHQRGNKSS